MPREMIVALNIIFALTIIEVVRTIYLIIIGKEEE